MVVDDSEQKIKFNKQYGFDQPIPVRYVAWLGKAMRGDLGYPYRGSKTVAMQISERIGPTVVLMGTSLVISILIGIPMGIYMALRPYTLGDYLITAFSFAQLAFPSFFVGLGMIYLFSLKFDMLPPFGMSTIGSEFSFVDRLQHLIMPATVLGAFNAGVWARYARSGMLAERAFTVCDGGARQRTRKCQGHRASCFPQRPLAVNHYNLFEHTATSWRGGDYRANFSVARNGHAYHSRH